MADSSITADEIALYDRQIRLWGLQAQEKLRTAHILLINVKALGNEIAKNLVLAGVGALTLADNSPVTEEDLSAQFFVTEEDVGKPRALAASGSIQRLNNRVSVHVEPQDILSLDPTYLGNFTMTIATDLPITTLSTLNAACRLSKCPFYAAGSHGFYGFVFADLIDHTFVITRTKSNVPTKIGPETATRQVLSVTEKREDDKTVELVTKRENYQPLILANTSPLSPEYLSSRRRLRLVTPLLPCLRAFWEFEKTQMRPPSIGAEADLKRFTALATEKTRELQLPPETLKSDFLRSFLQNLGAELAPVTATLGGRVAQDAINVLGMREQPIQNMLLFDGELSVSPVYALYPMVTTDA